MCSCVHCEWMSSTRTYFSCDEFILRSWFINDEKKTSSERLIFSGATCVCVCVWVCMSIDTAAAAWADYHECLPVWAHIKTREAYSHYIWTCSEYSTGHIRINIKCSSSLQTVILNVKLLINSSVCMWKRVWWAAVLLQFTIRIFTTIHRHAHTGTHTQTHTLVHITRQTNLLCLLLCKQFHTWTRCTTSRTLAHPARHMHTQRYTLVHLYDKAHAHRDADISDELRTCDIWADSRRLPSLINIASHYETKRWRLE